MPKTQKKIVELLRGVSPTPATPAKQPIVNVATATPALTEVSSAATSDGPGNSEDLETDPFHGVEKLHVGDEVIVRKKTNMGSKTLLGTIKTVGNHHLFGVVFTGEKIHFINRAQVLYYKLAERPEVDYSV